MTFQGTVFPSIFRSQILAGFQKATRKEEYLQIILNNQDQANLPLKEKV